jgi:hypothetical protein
MLVLDEDADPLDAVLEVKVVRTEKKIKFIENIKTAEECQPLKLSYF